MISALIGLALSIVIIIFAKVTRFERDRSFFCTILIVIASYYVLFAVIAERSIIRELIVASAFVSIAILGSYKSLTIIGFGIVAHGIYDIFYMLYIKEIIAPIWWPSFCAALDIVMGLWVVYLSRSRVVQFKPHVT
jgi:hypothetical protein